MPDLIAGPPGFDRSPRRIATGIAVVVGVMLLLVGVFSAFGNQTVGGASRVVIGDPTRAAQADATWVAEAVEFTSAPERIPAGPVTLALTISRDGPVHNVVLVGRESDGPLLQARQEGTYVIDVEIPAGDYVYYCSIASHRAQGMEGRLTVG